MLPQMKTILYFYWYFMSLIFYTQTIHIDFYYNFNMKEIPQNCMYKSSWGWTLGWSKHVEDTI